MVCKSYHPGFGDFCPYPKRLYLFSVSGSHSPSVMPAVTAIHNVMGFSTGRRPFGTTSTLLKYGSNSNGSSCKEQEF